ncbi:PREDICTED: uncharacterized protein LOC104602684 [Nelumbo nucifera]|uniref:Uncharacterized protein LOC104602684 n=1 Tax=Nelumbo nucifera TaxID=4432 RepID=A0A1U8APF8_NELNU|nr:PREDICTED: uncharacterized protein LOC104602684 [Nelumbo nucifera]
MEAEKIDGQRLFRQMKRKKRVAKKACIESPQASAEAQPSQAPVPKPELPGVQPIIDLEEDVAPQGPKTAAEPTTKPAETAARGATKAAPKARPTRATAGACSIGAAAEASKESAHAAEMMASSSESQGVKVNSVVRALTFQSDRHLKRALEAEKSSRAAHTELRAARGQIHRLQNDASAHKSFIEVLLAEKSGLARDKDRLRAEVNGFNVIQEALRLEVDSLKADRDSLKADRDGLEADWDSLKLEVQGLKEAKGKLEREVEYLRADLKEKTEIFEDALKETKVRAVIDYVQSSRFDEVMTEAYRKGFKLSRWLIRHLYPGLDTSAITTSRITDDIVRQSADDPDSEDEGANDEVEATGPVTAPEEVPGKDNEPPK